MLIVGNTREPVFAPAIRARSCLVVTEIVPGIAILTVVFANGAPLALTQVWPPFFPRNTLQARLPQTCRLCRAPRRFIQQNPSRRSHNQGLWPTKTPRCLSTFFAID